MERPQGQRRTPGADFGAVYDEHIWQVYGFFAYRQRDRTEAEDLTQQTFENALRAWGRFDPARASVATWLLTIARNLLVDHARRSRNHRHVPLDDAGEHAALTAGAERYDLGLAPELEAALAELSDRERELIALRFGADLSCPEIAALTGLTLANVQQILSRSLRRMRVAIDHPPLLASAE